MKTKLIKNIGWPALFLLLAALSSCGQISKNTQVVATGSADTGSMMNKPDDFWKNKLTAQEYEVLREKGTEKPYSGALVNNHDSGVYACKGCGNVLFSSAAKFESHTGWPSFDDEIAKGRVILRGDNAYGMSRTEVVCGRCGCHLGHLFDDGPTKTGNRYCMNSVALQFIKTGSMPE